MSGNIAHPIHFFSVRLDDPIDGLTEDLQVKVEFALVRHRKVCVEFELVVVLEQSRGLCFRTQDCLVDVSVEITIRDLHHATDMIHDQLDSFVKLDHAFEHYALG